MPTVRDPRRCYSYYCHGACGRKPVAGGVTRTPARAKRRRREQIAKASRKANR